MSVTPLLDECSISTTSSQLVPITEDVKLEKAAVGSSAAATDNHLVI